MRMSKQQTTAITVSEILDVVWKREKRLLAKVPKGTLISIRQRYHLQHEEVRREESRRLGVSLHKPRAFDVLLKHFYAAARGIKPGHFTNELVWPESVAMYCEFRQTGEKNRQKYNAIDIEDVVDELQRGDFAAELLAALWAECPEEYEAMELPPPRRTPMTDGQKRLWDALTRRALTGKELMKELDTSDDTVRQWVRELRSNGYDVPNKRGRGYCRADAASDDLAPSRPS